MKVLAGSLKGRKLYPRGRKIPARPISAKAKETAFNVLSPFFSEDFRFLDLFAGTGGLSIEALSRGAKEAHAVENHPLCLKIIRQNAGLLPHPKKLVLHKKNVFSLLRQTQKLEGDDDETQGIEQKSPEEQATIKFSKRSRIAQKSASAFMGLAHPFDIIVADPPFALRAGDRILSALQESCLIKKGTAVFIETGAQEELKKNYQGLCLFSVKLFSDKKLWFYEQR